MLRVIPKNRKAMTKHIIYDPLPVTSNLVWKEKRVNPRTIKAVTPTLAMTVTGA